MMKIIKNIFYFIQLIDSYNGVYYGWEVFFEDKRIAELHFTNTRCGREYLYEVVIVNCDFNVSEIKDIFESKGVFKNLYFSSIDLKPEIDFFCNYYLEFNKLGAQYLKIYENNDHRYNKFYKLVVEIVYFYRVFFPNKRRKQVVVDENCSRMKRH
ncbi:hypothetical protein FIA58_010520 [Flavobacterium jejuense]|uniref:Uncharacterized protein n=1 Tax=Flavobacterium jejuense TaxID=1544455 RepID=A0ABX0ISN7_9FLAO|nr:hypothetical protein [Flavobacterium jejuense]NHN26110.1 hypothetical protein [Flavobacterium jejuense]